LVIALSSVGLFWETNDWRFLAADAPVSKMDIDHLYNAQPEAQRRAVGDTDQRRVAVLRAISRRGEVRLEVRNPRQTSRRRVSRRGQWPRLSEREHEPSPVRDALNGVDPDGAI
jgi:hypothetical protein